MSLNPAQSQLPTYIVVKKATTWKGLWIPRKCDSDFDPSVPLWNECYLLKLPGELRNRIYEYVLTGNNDIIDLYHNTDLGTFQLIENTDEDEDDTVEAANPLRLVGKQTKAETDHLITHINTIKADGFEFFAMMKVAPRIWINSITSVELDADLKFLDPRHPNELTLQTLMQVARDNPHIYIKVNLMQFDQKNLQSLMSIGYSIIRAIRDKWMTRPWCNSNWVREWRQGREVEDVNVNNLKFCPWDGPCMEYVLARKLRSRETVIARAVMGYYQGDVEGIVADVKDWYANGI